MDTRMFLFLLPFLVMGLTLSCKKNKVGQSSQSIHVAQFGAKGDGRRDDTPAIQAAINASKGRPIVFDKKKYIVSKTIRIPSNTTFIGNGATIAMPPKTGFHLFLISKARNIEISDLRFQGNRQQYSRKEIERFRDYFTFRISDAEQISFRKLIFQDQASSCLQMTGIKDVEINECTFRNIGLSTTNWGSKKYSYDAVFIGGQQVNRNIVIRNSTFSFIGQYDGVKRYTNDGDGIQILNLAKGETNQVLVENCTFEECSSRGIKIQTGNNIQVRNNTFRYCGSGVGMAMSKPISNIEIHNNRFVDTRFVLTTNSKTAITADSVIVFDNQVDRARDFLRTSGNSSVRNSHFYNNTINGLDLYFVSGRFQQTVFEKNQINNFGLDENPDYYMAFLIWNGSKGVKIRNNTIATTAKTNCVIYFKKEVSHSLIENNQISMPNKTGKEKHLFHYKGSLRNKSNTIRDNYFEKRKMANPAN